MAYKMVEAETIICSYSLFDVSD